MLQAIPSSATGMRVEVLSREYVTGLTNSIFKLAVDKLTRRDK